MSTLIAIMSKPVLQVAERRARPPALTIPRACLEHWKPDPPSRLSSRRVTERSGHVVSQVHLKCQAKKEVKHAACHQGVTTLSARHFCEVSVSHNKVQCKLLSVLMSRIRSCPSLTFKT